MYPCYLISKGWSCQILGRDKWKNKKKLENAQFPKASMGDSYHLSLNGKNTPILLFLQKIPTLT